MPAASDHRNGIFSSLANEYIVRAVMRYHPGIRQTVGAASGICALLIATTTALAQDRPPRGLHLELGATVGGHIFASDLELGVADDPALPSPKSSIAFGLRAALALHPMFSLELEGVGIPTSDSINDYSAFIIGWRGHALVHFMDGAFQPFVLAGAGALSVVQTAGDAYEDINKDTDLVFHGGIGAKYWVTPTIALRLDARGLAVPNVEDGSVSPDFEILAGIGFAIGGAPPPPPPPVVPLVRDSDRDDIPDNLDKCPMEPEDKDGFQDADGCPDPDNDGDGILDAQDKCPLEAETKNGIDDDDGCPEEDKDGDGIFGTNDRCPEEPEDKDNFQDEDGCPDPDNDQDGVADGQDKCPTDPETKNGYQDEDGCPDQVPAAVAKFTGVIAGINFRVNSADIKPSSFKILKQAVKVLKDYPDLRIEISGHTSNEGKADFNMELSRKRAESVKAYLVSAGIDEGRISTVGYGPEKPIADNSTKKGRDKNRRIEFRLVSQGGDKTLPAAGPTPTPTPAPAPTPPADPKP
jgi:OOP family OmpA-OmpF porin